MTKAARKKLLTLSAIWLMAAMFMILVSPNIISFNSGLLSIPGIAYSFDYSYWFAPFLGYTVISFVAIGIAYIGYKFLFNRREIPDKVYNTLRLTGFTICASTAGIFVLVPLTIGLFSPQLLNASLNIPTGGNLLDVQFSFHIPTGYLLSWVILWIAFILPAPFLAVIINWLGGTSNRSYRLTRNWMLWSMATSVFLFPLILSGQGIWFLQGTRLNSSAWQPITFFTIFLAGQLAAFFIWTHFIVEKVRGLEASVQVGKSSIFMTAAATMVWSGALYILMIFVFVPYLYPSANELLQAQIRGDSLMYKTMFGLAIIGPVAIWGTSIVYRYWINPETNVSGKTITARFKRFASKPKIKLGGDRINYDQQY